MLMILVLLLTAVCHKSQASSATECLKNYGRNISHFAVLPGFGWDNLRNVEVSRVVEFNYSDCQLTNDGLYFLPNGVDTIPLKQSKLDVSSEIFRKYTEYSSVTSKLINENPGFRFTESISGAFSDSFLNSKSIQIMEKSVIVRSQMRFVKYKAKLEPDAMLSPAFKVALLSIARHILFNRTKMARYESEVLVRDFGTHVITSIDAGAALVLEDHLKSDYVNDSLPNMKRNILIGASKSLSEATKTETQSITDQAAVDEYQSNLLHSFVQTYGGPMFRITNTSSTWANDLEDNMVAIGREGIPLYNFINIQTVPSIPSSILYDVTSFIENAVKSYYAYNTFPGCTKIEDSNFKMQTNVDDGSCETDPVTVKFAGVFQMCEVVKEEAGDLCSHLKQPHLGTLGFICPSKYQSRLIHKSHLTKTSSKRVCKKCYGLFNCCDDTPVSSSADLKSFWCSSTEDTVSNYYKFAGMYSSVIDNDFTNSKSCPKTAHSRLIGDDISICLTNNDTTSGVLFGGMFSCNEGNPLAKESKDNLNPKGCPRGFSARLAGLIDDCEIYFCVLLSVIPDSTSTVYRPPFSPKIKLYPDEGADAVYDPDKQEWLTDLESRELKESEAAVELTSGEAAAIAIFVTIAFLVLLGCVVFFYRRSQRKYSADRRNGTTGGTREDAI